MVGAQPYNYAHFGSGTGPIAFRNVGCGGGESRLIDCARSTYTYYCSHGHDAGVRCQIRTSKSMY